jgi:hypothetical protein
MGININYLPYDTYLAVHNTLYYVGYTGKCEIGTRIFRACKLLNMLGFNYTVIEVRIMWDQWCGQVI